MKLVVVYNVSDGCTYSYDNIVPIEYLSEEQFICDFENELNLSIQNKSFEFMLGGHKFCTIRHYTSVLLYNPELHFEQPGSIIFPEIYTLDNWFEKFKGKP